LVALYHIFFSWRFFRKSFSQFGEDLIISHLLDTSKPGFYVDIGAHRPTQFSNTYFFYRYGWKGINVDAMPGSMKLFNILRSRDINIEAAVAGQTEKKFYYVFNRPLQNGIYDEDDDIFRNKEFTVIKKIDITTVKLSDILDKHLPAHVHVDFLSVDVEGLDVEVLKSNNWNKYKPKIILVEVLDFKLENLADYEVTKYLSQWGYTFYSRTVHTIIFLDSSVYSSKEKP